MSYLDELSRELARARDPRSDARSHPRRGRRPPSLGAGRGGAFRLAGRDRERVRGGARVAGVAAGRVPRLRGAGRRRRGLRRRVRVAGVREPADRDADAGARRGRARGDGRRTAGRVRGGRARARPRAPPSRPGDADGRAASPAPPHARSRSRPGVVTMGALALYGRRVRAVARRVVDDGDVRLRDGARRCCSSLPPSRPPAPRASGRSSPAPRATSSTTSALRDGGDPWRLACCGRGSPSERRSGSPASSRAIRSTASSAGSSKRRPVSPASRRSGGTSASVASIGACRSPRPSAISQT